MECIISIYQENKIVFGREHKIDDAYCFSPEFVIKFEELNFHADFIIYVMHIVCTVKSECVYDNMIVNNNIYVYRLVICELYN